MPTMKIERFESVPSFCAHVRKIGVRESGNGHEWDLGVSGPEALKRGEMGDPTIATETSAIMDRIVPSFREEEASRWVAAPMGTRVSVPEYLGGNPMCMRRRAKRETTARHLSIYVDLGCAAMVGASHMMKRGATILGFLEWLTRHGINVDLYLVSGAGTREVQDLYHVVRCDTRPLDISVSGFAIAHPAFARHVAFSAETPYGFRGAFSASSVKYRRDPQGYERFMRGLLDMQPGDIYVPESYAYDPLVTDPVKWVEERVSQISETT